MYQRRNLTLPRARKFNVNHHLQQQQMMTLKKPQASPKINIARDIKKLLCTEPEHLDFLEPNNEIKTKIVKNETLEYVKHLLICERDAQEFWTRMESSFGFEHRGYENWDDTIEEFEIYSNFFTNTDNNTIDVNKMLNSSTRTNTLYKIFPCGEAKYPLFPRPRSENANLERVVSLFNVFTGHVSDQRRKFQDFFIFTHQYLSGMKLLLLQNTIFSNDIVTLSMTFI